MKYIFSLLLTLFAFTAFTQTQECNKAWYWYSQKHYEYLVSYYLKRNVNEVNGKQYTLLSYKQKNKYTKRCFKRWPDTKLVYYSVCSEKDIIQYGY